MFIKHNFVSISVLSTSVDLIYLRPILPGYAHLYTVFSKDRHRNPQKMGILLNEPNIFGTIN